MLNYFPLSVFQSSSLISNATATALLSLGAIDYCLHVLKSLLEFWKSQQGEEEPVTTSQLLRPHTASSPPDMSPFFLRQYVKVRHHIKENIFICETFCVGTVDMKCLCCSCHQGHAADVFEAYSQLLTEMVLRLPYQIKKIADTNPRIPPPVFDHSWFYYLSEVCILFHLLFVFSTSVFKNRVEMNTCQFSLPLLLSTWWSSRLRLSGGKSESCFCLYAAPRRNIVSCGICTLLTHMCEASRSFWRSRASSSALAWLQLRLAQLYSMTHSSIWWVYFFGCCVMSMTNVYFILLHWVLS